MVESPDFFHRMIYGDDPTPGTCAVCVEQCEECCTDVEVVAQLGLHSRPRSPCGSILQEYVVAVTVAEPTAADLASDSEAESECGSPAGVHGRALFEDASKNYAIA